MDFAVHTVLFTGIVDIIICTHMWYSYEYVECHSLLYYAEFMKIHSVHGNVRLRTI